MTKKKGKAKIWKLEKVITRLNVVWAEQNSEHRDNNERKSIRS